MNAKGERIIKLARSFVHFLLASNSASRADHGMRILVALRHRKGTPTIRSIRLAPAFKNDSEAADLVNRCRWYLHGTGAHVIVEGSFPLESLPVSQPRYANTSVSIVSSREPSDGDCVAYWRVSGARLAGVWGREAYIVDPQFHLHTESTEWLRLRGNCTSAERSNELDATSRRTFKRFLHECRDKEEAFLFTTGPSLDAARHMQYPDTALRIVCNSMVKNQALLDHIRPDVVTFADDVFHFGPSLYAATFRDDLLATLERHPHCYACVPLYAMDLMLAHLPQLADRIIGVPFTNSQNWSVLSSENFGVRSTGNILTFLMLPVATAVCKRIAIVGADGRKDDEDYFWKHSDRNQFGDLMWSVFECHPSFFTDNDYRSYYRTHCEDLESQISWLETTGHSVRALTASHIPALHRRQASELLLSEPRGLD